MHLHKEIKRTIVTRISDTLKSMFIPHLIFSNKGQLTYKALTQALLLLPAGERAGQQPHHVDLITHHKWRPLIERGVATCRIFTITQYAEKSFITPLVY